MHTTHLVEVNSPWGGAYELTPDSEVCKTIDGCRNISILTYVEIQTGIESY
jgi:hypothetical protein